MLAASATVILLSYAYLEARSEHKEEFYLLLILATLAFVGGLVHALVSLRAGTWRDNRWNWVPRWHFGTFARSPDRGAQMSTPGTL